MESITAIALGTALAGLLAPLITALLNQPAFTSQTKLIVATGISFVLGVAAVWLTGGFNLGAGLAASQVLAVVGTSQTLYALILKPTGVADKITSLETIPALNDIAVQRAKNEAAAAAAAAKPTATPRSKKAA